MTAAKKMPGKPAAEMFDDIPVLQRKWRAALKPGERLPRYEDVMLGSLGRLADHIALLKNDGALELSRSGRYVQKWLGEERWDIPVAELSPDCATALSEAVASALENGQSAPGAARIACATAWSGPTMCWRCRPPRAGAPRWLAPTSTSAARNTISWTRSSRRPMTPWFRWRRCAMPQASRSISRSCTTTRAPERC